MAHPIILVTMNIAPVGGLTNDVIKCIRALRQQGRQVHVIYGFRGDGTLAAINDEQVNWHHIYMLKRPPVFAQLMLWFLAQLTIKSIRKHAPGAKVICFERLPLGDASIGTSPHELWLAARKKMNMSPFSKVPYKLWCTWMDRLIQHKQSHHIIVYSKRDIEALSDLGVKKERIEQVIIPTDTQRFQPSFSRSRKYITIIGNNPRLKGIDSALNIWPFIHKEHTDLVLRIITHSWKVKKLVEKHNLPAIETRPFQPNVEAYYQEARLVLMPSVFETWGNVIPEALASGVPVVASSDVPSCEIIAIDNNNGIVFQRDGIHDDERLQKAISQALNLPFDEKSANQRHNTVKQYMQQHLDLTSWITKQ